LNKASFLNAILVLIVLVCLNIGFCSTETVVTSYKMTDKSNVTILLNGDAQVTEVITMSATAFASFKQNYPQLSMFSRIFKPANSPMQIENLNISIDEFNNKIIASYLVVGQAVNKGDFWEIVVAQEGADVTLSAQSGRTVVFTFVGMSTTQTREIITSTITLPEGAYNIQFQESTNKLRYSLPAQASPAGVMVIIAIILIILGVLNYFFIFDRFLKKTN